MPESDIAVLVIGAGLTGCVLALELAHHGVRSLVVERSVRPPRHPGLSLVSGRGMELLRRLGLAEAIRAGGVAEDHAPAVVWSSSLERPPVLVSTVPSAGELRRRYSGNASGNAPIEPYALVAGTDLTRRLRDAVRAHPLVELREGWVFTDLRLAPDRTVATVLDGRSRTRHTIEARYLAGCDGARSTVRRCLGIPLEGQVTPADYCSVHFRCDGLGRPVPGPATIIADGLTLTGCSAADQWIGHLQLGPDDGTVTDPAGALQRRAGIRLDPSQVLGVTQWQQSLGIAAAYRHHTAYLAGQSAHQFEPAGDSVDTCLADAVDLGWKLAGALARWGGPGLLDSYERERRSRAVLQRELLGRSLESRRRFGRLATTGASPEYLARVVGEEPPQLDPAGTAPGGERVASPVVWREPAPHPDGAVRVGGRLPALRTADGRPLFDLLGPQFTLIDRGGPPAGRRLVDAARARGIPMTHLPLPADPGPPTWPDGLLLVRPDQHIAWQTTTRPPEWNTVLDVVTGNRTPRDALQRQSFG